MTDFWAVRRRVRVMKRGTVSRYPPISEAPAPRLGVVGPGAEVLARDPDGRPVAVRQARVLATAFHPELTPDRRIHRLLLQMVGEEVGQAG